MTETRFVERHNAKFAKAPARPDNLHRALNIEPDRLAEFFCLRDKRYVTRDLTIKHDRKWIKLEFNDLSRGLMANMLMSTNWLTDAFRCVPGVSTRGGRGNLGQWLRWIA